MNTKNKYTYVGKDGQLVPYLSITDAQYEEALLEMSGVIKLVGNTDFIRSKAGHPIHATCANRARLLASEYIDPLGQGALWQGLYFIDAVARVFGLSAVFGDDKESARRTSMALDRALELLRGESEHAPNDTAAIATKLAAVL